MVSAKVLAILALFLLIIPLIPALAAANPQVPLPSFQKRALLNGFEVLFLPSQDKQTHFLFMIRNGAAFDPAGKWGSTLLMTRLMLRSTERRDQEQIRFAMASLNARIEARVDYDAVYLLGSAPMGNLEGVLELLGDIVVRPRFGEEEFQSELAALLQEREEEAKRVETRTQEILADQLFSPHPYGHPIKGTLSTLRNLTLGDIKLQYRRLFLPNQAQLAFFHDGDQELMVRKISRAWGSWVQSEALPFTFRRAPETNGPRIFLIDAPQGASMLRWGKLGVDRRAPAYHALKVFEQYLLLSLPEWAAKVRSQDSIQAAPLIESRRMPGAIQLSIQAPPEDLPRYVEHLREFLRKLHEGRIEPEALEEAKSLAVMDFENSLGQPISRLQTLLEMTLYEIGAGYVTTYDLRVSRVDAERLREVLNQVVSVDDFVLVVAGPAERLRDSLRRFGPVEAVSLADSSEPDSSSRLFGNKAAIPDGGGAPLG